MVGHNHKCINGNMGIYLIRTEDIFFNGFALLCKTYLRAVEGDGPYGNRSEDAASILRAEGYEIRPIFVVVILLQARRLPNRIVCSHRSSQ